jgi:hypothetical protein
MGVGIFFSKEPDSDPNRGKPRIGSELFKNSDLVGICLPAHPCRPNYEFDVVLHEFNVCTTKHLQIERVNDRNNKVQLLVLVFH